VRRRPLASRFPLSTLLAVVLLLAIGWSTGLAAEERAAPWKLRVAPPGQPLARAIDLETIENVTAMVFDTRRPKSSCASSRVTTTVTWS
jgi:hypothetical protein